MYCLLNQLVVKHGVGGVTILVCSAATGPGYLIVTELTPLSNVRPSVQQLKLGNILFWYRAIMPSIPATEWLKNKIVKVLQLSGQSQDLILT